MFQQGSRIRQVWARQTAGKLDAPSQGRSCSKAPGHLVLQLLPGLPPLGLLKLLHGGVDRAGEPREAAGNQTTRQALAGAGRQALHARLVSARWVLAVRTRHTSTPCTCAHRAHHSTPHTAPMYLAALLLSALAIKNAIFSQSASSLVRGGERGLPRNSEEIFEQIIEKILGTNPT